MRGALLLVAALGLVAGCDWQHYNMMNSIPFRGNGKVPKEFHVYLGIDGLSFRSVSAARTAGAFPGDKWRAAKLVTMFPGTSDASWTRILHTKPIPGYEFEHYDPIRDEIQNTGIIGYLCHAMPHFSKGLNFEPDYLSAFDYRANGFLHTVGAYVDTFSNVRESFDNLFTMMEGRSRTSGSFTGYLLEIDVLGHMKTAADIGGILGDLSRRLEAFRARHPDREVHFTIFSDHGMDFIPVKQAGLVKFDEEMAKVGVTPVENMRNRDPAREIFAVTIMHTRVTYLELHTHPSLVTEVAKRVSKIPAVDVAIARAVPLPNARTTLAGPLEWFAVWEKGEMLVRFGYHRGSNRYFVPADARWARLDLGELGAAGREYSDRELFLATQNHRYPDLFYRIRAALTPGPVRYPGDVVVSLKGGFASVGKELPGGASDMAMSAFHGALDAPGTIGTLLTDERDLPGAVRSDDVLALFPRLKAHVVQRGVQLFEGEAEAALDYR